MAHSLEARLPYWTRSWWTTSSRCRVPRSSTTGGPARSCARRCTACCPARSRRGARRSASPTPEVPLVPAAARGAAEPDALTVLSRPSVLEGRGGRRRFRRACAGEVEESMFFWRAVNAEVWLRVYIDGKTRALDEHSYEGGFVRRGDRAAAKKIANGRTRCSTAHTSTGAGTCSSRTRTDLGALPAPIDAHQAGRRSARGDRRQSRTTARRDHRRGRRCPAGEREGTAISQGARSPSTRSRCRGRRAVLSRYVSHEPTGVGLAHPTTMQLAIDEAGAGRILLAAAAAAVTKPLGMRGSSIASRVMGSTRSTAPRR